MEFADRVSEQHYNQSATALLATPRLEGYEAALRIYGYHPDDWPQLVEWAVFIHHLRHKTESPGDMVRRITRGPQYPHGVSLAELQLEDVIDHGPYA